MAMPIECASFKVVYKVEILHNGHVWIQRWLFRQIPDALLGVHRILQNVNAVDQSAAGCGG